MTALQFYKYIESNDIEWRWVVLPDPMKQDVLIFPRYCQIEELGKIMSPTDFEDGRITCIMKHGYFAIWASDILEGYDIEVSEVFEKETE